MISDPNTHVTDESHPDGDAFPQRLFFIFAASSALTKRNLLQISAVPPPSFFPLFCRGRFHFAILRSLSEMCILGRSNRSPTCKSNPMIEQSILHWSLRRTIVKLRLKVKSYTSRKVQCTAGRILKYYKRRVTERLLKEEGRKGREADNLGAKLTFLHVGL